MKRVELLAPAGNYEALTGAIIAGADAVYLGGDAFGARAYADNFTKEEICKGIRFAHLFGRKIYLTVNTLVKEKEFSQLYNFLLPFYKEGLDGVIIQDFGVFQFIRKHFPGLSLHVSTQMTITGAYGAGILKEAGAERVVPARELSLEEIREIKEKVDIEIETFIHGAMCYCYSGQCLLSSILGGRSGNRGRCAQPCRLPYKVASGKESYPLSMKDMCTITMLPELVEAGIDSFKIEGRMKKPEYSAGVTAIYRKYLDVYYQNPSHYQVAPEDIEYLKALYIRSDIMEGYYHRHNGKEMITLSSPAYSGSNQELLAEIRRLYIDIKPILPVKAEAVFHVNQSSILKLTCGKTQVVTYGPAVQRAEKQPLPDEKIKEQLKKSGNTNFEIELLSLDKDEAIFMPVSALNQLRRDAIAELEERLIEKNGFLYSDRNAVACVEKSMKRKASPQENCHLELHALVGNQKQLEAAFESGISRIYLDKMMIDDAIIDVLSKYKKKRACQFYLAFPYVVRKRDENGLEQLFACLQQPVFDGALVRNVETISFLKKMRNDKLVVSDSNLYIYNKEAVSFLQRHTSENYLPVELNQKELEELLDNLNEKDVALSMVAYGRLPMMISANCLKKTTGSCQHNAGYISLKDRYAKEFPVYTDCTYCYNIIYNSVPLSLHKLFKGKEKKPVRLRLDFTVESGEETKQIIHYFKEIVKSYKDPFYHNFTTGHYKRGVE